MFEKFKKNQISMDVMKFVKGGYQPTVCENCKASAPDACTAAGNTGNNLQICIRNINDACDAILGCS